MTFVKFFSNTFLLFWYDTLLYSSFDKHREDIYDVINELEYRGVDYERV